jgi:hypothetical protein
MAAWTWSVNSWVWAFAPAAFFYVPHGLLSSFLNKSVIFTPVILHIVYADIVKIPI